MWCGCCGGVWFIILITIKTQLISPTHECGVVWARGDGVGDGGGD